MIKRAILAIIALIMIVTGGAMLAYGEEIDIQTENDAITVVETHTIDATESDTIAFWIQSGHSDVVITTNGSVDTYSPSSHIYYLNISEFNITSESIIQVSYNLNKNTDKFEKILQYDTDSLTISFDGNEIYSGNNLAAQSSLILALQKQVPGQTVPVENIPIWIYIIITVLVVLLIVVIGSGRKQKTTTKKEGIGGSEELLTTKKSLLMETLKEIEKKHRSKQISDDTYNKLKDEFKQDAVEAMKKLEDLKK